MTDSDSLMVIADDEQDESRLYIDENVLDSLNNHLRQQTKSTFTGNPFELDLNLIENINRYQTRSSQTVLTSNTSFLLKRHRSTFCQAEYFETKTQNTNTDQDDNNNKEELISVVKKQRTENDVDLVLSLST